MAYIFSLVMALIFADTVLYGVIVPLIPVYTQVLGLSELSIGAIYAAYSLGLLLFSMPMGMGAERIGYKKTLSFGVALLSLSCAIYGLVTNALFLAICRFLQGVAAAATWTGGLALMAVMYPDRQGEKLGLILAAMGVGTVLGPPLGGFLYEYLGYRSMFYVLAMGFLVLLFMILKAKGELPQAPGGKGQGAKKLPWSSSLFWLCVVVVWISSSFGMLEIVMPGYLSRRFTLGSLEIGLAFGFMGIIHGLGDAVVGYWSDRLGYVPFVFWGLLAGAWVFPLLALAPNLYWLLLTLSLFGLVMGAALTPSQPLMYKLVTEALAEAEAGGGAGLAYGLFNTCYSLGLTVGPLLGGFLNQTFNLATTLLVYTGVFLALSLLFKMKIMGAKALRE